MGLPKAPMGYAFQKQARGKDVWFIRIARHKTQRMVASERLDNNGRNSDVATEGLLKSGGKGAESSHSRNEN